MSKLIDTVLVDEGSALFTAERKVYPRDIRGRHDTLRRIAVVVLLGMYYSFAWLRWDGRRRCCSICRRASSTSSA